MKKPSGSAAAKQASSARPGFQPSAAAQFTAIEISSGRIVRMLRSLLAGDRADGLMNRTPFRKDERLANAGFKFGKGGQLYRAKSRADRSRLNARSLFETSDTACCSRSIISQSENCCQRGNVSRQRSRRFP